MNCVGHKLKNNKGNQLIQSIKQTRCTYKIILTGTPIQNDLSELYALCEFVNPSYLGDYQTFNHEFIHPIQQGRHRNSTVHEQYHAEQKSTQLKNMINTFVLRRNQSILVDYLGVKYESILFIPLSTQQSIVYKLLVQPNKLMVQANNNTNVVLTIIQMLQKITNSLSLFLNHLHEYQWLSDFNILSAVDMNSADYIDSTKLQFTEQLCHTVQQNHEKIVIVSGYTKTLDIIESLCTNKQWLYYRLDGSTNSNTRSDMIDAFNNKYSKHFIFLLSKQAGGIGINLIGANRLILFEPSWNPSLDTQSIARIWRDGQTRPVYIYRLISSNTIDEKILQRQLNKNNISHNVMDNKTVQCVFDTNELRQLLLYRDDIVCDTYNILNKSQSTGSHTQQWNYYHSVGQCNDSYIKSMIRPKINFIFSRSTTDPDENIGETINNDAAILPDDTIDSFGDFIVSDTDDTYNPKQYKSNKRNKLIADPRYYIDPTESGVDSDEATLSDLDNNPDNNKKNNQPCGANNIFDTTSDSIPTNTADDTQSLELPQPTYKRLRQHN